MNGHEGSSGAEGLEFDPINLDDYAWAREQFEKEGWVVIPDVLTSEQADIVCDRLWKAKEAGEKRGDATYINFLDPNPSNVRVFYLMELDKIFRDLISHPLAISMAKTVLGDDILISNFTANIARPGSESMALHSDQSIVAPDPWKDVWAMNCMFCLSDVYEKNGATLYIPGSNKWVYRSEIPEDAPSMLRPFNAKKGSIICMDARVWHTSGANKTKDVDRPILFAYFTKPFLRQQVNWTAKLPEEIKKSLSDEMFEMLGLGPAANVGREGDFRFLKVQYPDGKRVEGEPVRGVRGYAR